MQHKFEESPSQDFSCRNVFRFQRANDRTMFCVVTGLPWGGGVVLSDTQQTYTT